MRVARQTASALIVGIVIGVLGGAVGTTVVYEHDWLASEPPRPHLPRPLSRPGAAARPAPGIEVVSLAALDDAAPPSMASAPSFPPRIHVPFAEQRRNRAWARPRERGLKARLKRHLGLKPLDVECRASCCRIELRPTDWREQQDALQTDLGLSGRWSLRTENAGDQHEAAAVIVCEEGTGSPPSSPTTSAR